MWRGVIGILALLALGLWVSGYFQQRKHPETFPALAAAVGLGLLIAFGAGYVAGRVVRRHVKPAAPGYSLRGSGASSKPPGWVYVVPLIGALVPVGMQSLARASPQAADVLAAVAAGILTVLAGVMAAQLPWPPDPNDPKP